MDPLQEEIIKHREIHFQPDLSDTELANNAVTLLTGAHGILEVRTMNSHCIAVSLFAMTPSPLMYISPSIRAAKVLPSFAALVINSTP